METNHAEQNAKGWAGTIAELVAALECDFDRLEELREERKALANAVNDAAADLKAAEFGSANATDERLMLDPEQCAESLADAKKASEEAVSELAAWDAEHAEELAELTAAATVDGELYASADDVRERIQEGPLEVSIRSGWYSPGDDPEPEEFAILLSTGGPALRIRGELGQHGEPRRAWLEYQDWGTPWTEYHPGTGEGCDQQTFLTYCQQFYFGD